MNGPTFCAFRWMISALAIAVLSAGGVSRGADHDWLKPVEAGYVRLDAKLKNFTVRGRFLNKEDPPGKPPGKRELIHAFEFSRLDNCVKTAREDAAGNGITYFVANDSYFFAVQNSAPGGLAALHELGDRRDFKFANIRRRATLKQLLGDATGILGNYGFPLESPLAVLKHNAPHLKAQETTLAGHEVLLLEGNFQRYTDATGMQEEDVTGYTAPNSRIFLDPALDYRIVRWEMQLVHEGKNYVYTDTYEYEHAVDGYPLLSRYVSEVGMPVYSTQEIEFLDWHLNENKPAEFRLSHFGLKEPNYGSKTWLSGWVWLLLVGAALVVVGGWLYRRSSSRAQ